MTLTPEQRETLIWAAEFLHDLKDAWRWKERSPDKREAKKLDQTIAELREMIKEQQ